MRLSGRESSLQFPENHMPKVKLIAGGFVLLVGIAGIVAAYMIVSANSVNKDVNALKGWEPPKGVRLERLSKKTKKMGALSKVLKHKTAAVPYLVEAVKTWGSSEAVGAMMALALLGAPEGIPPLVGILKRSEGEGGHAAAAALGRYRGKAVPALKEASSGAEDYPTAVRSNLYKAMAWSRSDDLVEVMAGGLKDPEAEVAVTVADLLATRKSKGLVAPLMESLASDAPALSESAVKGLIHNKKFLKVDQFKAPLASPKPHVRANALTVLGRLDRVFASKLVKPCLEDSAPLVRVAAAESLFEMSEKVKPAKILPLLESDEAVVTERAAEILRNLKDTSAQDKYIALLDHKNLHTRKAAVVLLGVCAKSDPGYLIDHPFVEKLIGFLKHPELAAESADALRLWTRQHSLENSHEEWIEWWEVKRELEKRLKEARGVYTTVKKWLDDGEIRKEGRAREAVDMIQKAISIYEEIKEKNLSRRGYENEVQKLILLQRQASTHLMGD
jgi:HEAT repeat protein